MVETCYLFTPNTITYAVPVVKTGLAKKLTEQRLVLYFILHTGKTMKGLSASFGASVVVRSTNVFFAVQAIQDNQVQLHLIKVNFNLTTD